VIDPICVGKQTLLPGYDVVCTVKGDLENCYDTTPYTTAASGTKFKEVVASPLVAFHGNIFSPVALIVRRLSWLGGDGDNRPLTVGRRCMSAFHQDIRILTVLQGEPVYGPATIAYD
jgi:hypothetical protein